MADWVSFGARMRRLRQERLWRLADAVAAAGVDAEGRARLSDATLSELERGKLARPGMEIIGVLADLYHLDPNTLCRWAGVWEGVQPIELEHHLRYAHAISGRLLEEERGRFFAEIAEITRRYEQREGEG